MNVIPVLRYRLAAARDWIGAQRIYLGIRRAEWTYRVENGLTLALIWLSRGLFKAANAYRGFRNLPVEPFFDWKKVEEDQQRYVHPRRKTPKLKNAHFDARKGPK